MFFSVFKQCQHSIDKNLFYLRKNLERCAVTLKLYIFVKITREKIHILSTQSLNWNIFIYKNPSCCSILSWYLLLSFILKIFWCHSKKSILIWEGIRSKLYPHKLYRVSHLNIFDRLFIADGFSVKIMMKRHSAISIQILLLILCPPFSYSPSFHIITWYWFHIHRHE